MSDSNAATLADLANAHTLVFAGGGNRCWWQAGLMSGLRERGHALPANVVGTSAGAAMATALVASKIDVALQACVEAFGGNARVVHRTADGWRFAHESIYPRWIETFVNADTFPGIARAATRVRVAVTRPSPRLGELGSVVAGIAVYFADRLRGRQLHAPTAGHVGLSLEHFALDDCASHVEAGALLTAAAAAPPFFRTRRIAGRMAMDGGFTDSAPISGIPSHDRSGALVLLTRFLPRLPSRFQRDGITYWQPSGPVPVSTWGCTRTTDMRRAFDLGLADAARIA